MDNKYKYNEKSENTLKFEVVSEDEVKELTTPKSDSKINVVKEENQINKKNSCSFNEEEDLKAAKYLFEILYYRTIHETISAHEVPIAQKENEEIFEMFIQFYRGLVATLKNEKTDFDLPSLKEKYGFDQVYVDACYNWELNIEKIVHLFSRIFIDIHVKGKEKALKEMDHLQLDYNWKLISCCDLTSIESIFRRFEQYDYYYRSIKNTTKKFYCYFNGKRIDNLMTEEEAYKTVYGCKKENISHNDTYYLMNNANGGGDAYHKLFYNNTKKYIADYALNRWHEYCKKHYDYGATCLSEVLLAIGRSGISSDEAFKIIDAQNHSGATRSWTISALCYYSKNGRELEKVFNGTVKKYAKENSESIEQSNILFRTINMGVDYIKNTHIIRKNPKKGSTKKLPNISISKKIDSKVNKVKKLLK